MKYDIGTTLERLVDCFDTAGKAYQIEVVVNGETVIADITEETQQALEEALYALYGSEDPPFDEDN